MQELTLDILAHRLTRLEREVRRWRLGATIVLTCILAVLVMGQTVLPNPQVIEAQRFVLRQPDGTVRAILGLSHPAFKGGDPWDSRKTAGGWGLHIFGAEGRYRAGLMAGPSAEGDGGGWLKLIDKDTKSEADLILSSGWADFRLKTTTQSHEGWDRQHDEWLKSGKAVMTPQENKEWNAARPSPDSSVRLLLTEGKTAFTLSEKDGAEAVLGRVALTKLHGVVEQRPLSSLVFFDKDRTVIWKAP